MIMRRRSIVPLLAILLAGASRSSAAQGAAVTPPTDSTKKPIDGIAAIVGDKVVLISEVNARVNVARSKGMEPRNALEYAQMQKQALNDAIDEELLVQKARAEKIEVDEGAVSKELESFEKRAQASFKSETEFRAALRQAGFGNIEEWRRMQQEDYRRTMMQQNLMQKLRHDGKLATVNVTEKEVREAYDKDKDQIPPADARVSIRQIVIPTTPSEESKKRAKAKADSIYNELVLHPGDFESIAKRESMDESNKNQGGDLGWNRRGHFVPSFDRVVFAMNPGTTSRPFETPFGYHIVRVDRVQPGEVKARHILIMPSVDSTDEVRARQRAAEAMAKWKAGVSFDSLSREYHDAEVEESVINDFIRDSLPEQYLNAVKGGKQNDIIGPFAIPNANGGASKFVVLQLTMVREGGVQTYEDLRERIRDHLSQERTFRRYIDTLKQQTYVSVRFDPMAGLPPDGK